MSHVLHDAAAARPGIAAMQIDRLIAEADHAETAGDIAGARDGYLRALALCENAPLIHYKLGRIYFQSGDPGNALAFFARACELMPEWPEAQHNLGVAAMSLGLDADAARAFGVAARLRPEFVDSIVNRVTLLARLGLAEQALDEGTLALERHPSDARLWTSLSAALGDLGMREGESAAIEAIRLDPLQTEAWLNFGNACARRLADRDAIAAFRHGLEVAPDDARLRTALAFALLRQGELEEGFAHYEHRFGVREYRWQTALPATVLLWRGEPLAGRSIVLLQEQGYGDTLHFIRYAALLAAQGASVSVHVPAALVRLATRCPGVAHASDDIAALPPADFFCPIMSLPHRFGTTIESVPSAVPYIQADPADVIAFRERLAADPVAGNAARVGFVWAGDPRHGDRRAQRVDRRRSLPFSALEHLARHPGVAAYSLQKGSAAAHAPVGALIDHMDSVRDFADTAALVHHLDLVVTVDTSVAHLAAAMGKPTFVLSRYEGCWRWLEGRDDSPWYPTLRLFRQTLPNAWCGAISSLGRAFGDFLTTRTSAGHGNFQTDLLTNPARSLSA